jgi:Transposase DDE domain
MGYIRGEGRSQGTLFPVVSGDLVAVDHVCRVIDTFVDGLAMADLGFERAEAAETGRSDFRYQTETDCMLCPEGKALKRKQLNRKDRAVYYQAEASDCGACSLKSRCTQSAQRMVACHLHEEALDRMNQRATPALMRLRRSTVEHPFGTLKYRIFGHLRLLLLSGLRGAQTEISIAVMAYT